MENVQEYNDSISGKQLKTENFLLNNIGGCYTNATRILMSTKSRFLVYIKFWSLNIKYAYCMIHRLALALKTLPISFVTFLHTITKVVNFIKRDSELTILQAVIY